MVICDLGPWIIIEHELHRVVKGPELVMKAKRRERSSKTYLRAPGCSVGSDATSS